MSDQNQKIYEKSSIGTSGGRRKALLDQDESEEKIGNVGNEKGIEKNAIHAPMNTDQNKVVPPKK